jgi:hypothetical protein
MLFVPPILCWYPLSLVHTLPPSFVPRSTTLMPSLVCICLHLSSFVPTCPCLSLLALVTPAFAHHPPSFVTTHLCLFVLTHPHSPMSTPWFVSTHPALVCYHPLCLSSPALVCSLATAQAYVFQKCPTLKWFSELWTGNYLVIWIK